MILYLYQVHFGSNLLFYFHGSTTIRCGNKVHIWLTMVQFSQLNHDNDVMMLFALLCNVLCVINLLLLISGNVINFLLLISINGINFLLLIYMSDILSHKEEGLVLVIRRCLKDQSMSSALLLG